VAVHGKYDLTDRKLFAKIDNTIWYTERSRGGRGKIIYKHGINPCKLCSSKEVFENLIRWHWHSGPSQLAISRHKPNTLDCTQSLQ